MRRLVFSPRWIMWHLLTLGAMATCGWLAVWQWDRAGSAMGTAVNVGYGLQWPLFAVFFGVMWWRMLRLEVRVRAKAAEDVVAGPGGGIGADEAAAPVAVPPQRAAPPAPAPSPFTARPRTVTVPAEPEDPELVAYNRMLAQLAARDTADQA